MTDLETSDTDRAALSEPSRQSPLAVVFLAWRVVRGISVVNLIVLGAVLTTNQLPVSAFALAPLVVGGLGILGLISWWRYTFVVDGDELVVSRGVVSQNRLVIPLDRVQSVSLEQGLLHRATGLTRVGLDTAGSAEVEFSIDAIPLDQAESLQRLAADYRRRSERSRDATAEQHAVGSDQIGSHEHEETEVLVTRNFGQLVRIAFGHWPWAGLVLLAPLLAAADDIAELIGLDFLNRLEEQVGGSPDTAVPSIPIGLIVAGVVLAIAVGAILSWSLQLVRQVLTDWDLTVTRTGRGLRRVAGLTNRTSVGSSLDRVQVLRTSAIPMQRWLGIARLNMVTVGDTNLVVPGTTQSELERFRELVFEGPGPDLDRRLSPAMVVLAVRNAAVVAVLATVFLVQSPVGWWGALALLAVPIEFVMARWRLRRQRWGLTTNRLGRVSRFVTHRTEEIDPIKAQSVTVRQSFFQRRRDLASVHIRAAEGRFELPMIPLAEATALRDLILYRVESTGRSWM